MKVATFGIPKRNQEKIMETAKPYSMSLEMETFIALANSDHRDSKSIKQFLFDLVFPCSSTPGRPENLSVMCFPKKTLQMLQFIMQRKKIGIILTLLC